MQTPQHHVLACRNLAFTVQAPDGRLNILEDISLELAAGENLAIVGASGSGKTTLLGLLAGLERCTSGDVWLDGKHLNAFDENARAKLRRQRVGFVFQSFHLLPSLTALENVLLALEIAGSDRARTRAEHALARVGLKDRLRHYPRQLSGGEQQRAAIARAFASEPAILFADEPTGSLDHATGAAVADVLFAMNREQGTALILVTHDPALAQRCERVIELTHGRLKPTASDTPLVVEHNIGPAAAGPSGQ